MLLLRLSRRSRITCDHDLGRANDTFSCEVAWSAYAEDCSLRDIRSRLCVDSLMPVWVKLLPGRAGLLNTQLFKERRNPSGNQARTLYPGMTFKFRWHLVERSLEIIEHW